MRLTTTLLPLALLAGCAAAPAPAPPPRSATRLNDWRVWSSPREATLRSHHLAHHFVNPRAYHGVTTRRWDRVFGTLPESWERDYARGGDRPPLEGDSNLRLIWNPIHAVERLRAAWHFGADE